jgi:hypothetical protein
MRYRKLRIAWSVAWGVMALLLIVFWVRSYWRHDILTLRSALFVNYQSVCGDHFLASHLDPWKQYKASKSQPDPRTIWDWKLSSVPAPVGERKRLGFSWLAQDGIAITAPHWFLVLVTGAGAAFPWIHLTNRFSLRTLLIATTLFAMLLGAIVYAVR